MSAAHVQTKDAQVASGSSVNVSLTSVGAGNHLTTATGVGAAAGLTSAAAVLPTSSPTATWANGIAANVDSAGDMAWRIDYSENVASGSWTVTVKSNATHEITGNVTESSGVATSSSIGVSSTSALNLTTSTVQPGSVTPTSGSILITLYMDASGNTSAATINSSFTVRSDSTAWNGANQRAGVATKDNVANSAVNPTWTNPAGSGFHIIATIIEFLAAAGGGATPVPPLMRTLRMAGV